MHENFAIFNMWNSMWFIVYAYAMLFRQVRVRWRQSAKRGDYFFFRCFWCCCICMFVFVHLFWGLVFGLNFETTKKLFMYTIFILLCIVYRKLLILNANAYIHTSFKLWFFFLSLHYAHGQKSFQSNSVHNTRSINSIRTKKKIYNA